jgi:hypothetical protein
VVHIDTDSLNKVTEAVCKGRVNTYDLLRINCYQIIKQVISTPKRYRKLEAVSATQV